jgi:hypothetical protein
MAIFWCDPYINSAANNGTTNGIHGTTDIVTRNGTYASPFSFLDISTTASTLSTVNGQVIQVGDEIRLKGMNLESFFFSNTGIANNLISVSGQANTVSSYVLNVANSIHRDALVAYRNDNQSRNYNAGLIMMYDTRLLGNNKVLFMPVGPDFANTAQTTATLKFFSTYFINAPTFYLNTMYKDASNFETKNVGLIDSKYFITGTESDSAVRNFFNVTANTSNATFGIKITDGWIDETTRGGSTVLPISRNSSSSVTVFNAITNSQRRNLELSNTHIVGFGTKGSFSTTGTFTAIFGNSTANTTGSLGTLMFTNQNAWNYYNLYFTGNDSDFQIDMLCPLYNFFGGNTGVGSNSKIRFFNIIGGGAIYSQGVPGGPYDVEFGNVILSAAYSGSVFFVPGFTLQKKIFFTANSFIFCNNLTGPMFGPDLIVPNISDIQANGNIYTYQTASSSPYSSINTSSNPGPQVLLAIANTNSLFASNTRIIAANIIEAIAQKDPTAQNYNYTRPSEINSSLGYLLTSGQNYKNVNAKIYLSVNSYVSEDFGSLNLHYAKNDYDGKPIGLMFPVTTSIGTFYGTMICYNEPEANNSLCIVCNDESSNTGLQYKKSTLVALPDLTGKTRINVSCTLDKTSNFGSTSLQRVRLVYRSNVGTSNTVLMTGTWSNTNQNGFFSSNIAISAIDNTISHVGLVLSVRSYNGPSNKYYFGNVNITTV